MPITLDCNNQTAHYRGKNVKLTRLEFALLQHLICNANRICPRDEILDTVWGMRFQYDTGTIDVHLNAIRRKLGLSLQEPIETFRGTGICYHSGDVQGGYTFNIQELIVEWLYAHEADLREKALVPQLHLDPFVSDIREHPDTFRRMLDAILQMLLPTAQPGYLRISTVLSISHFTFKIDINGTINELKIPIVCH